MELETTEGTSEMDHFQNLSLNSNDLRFKSVLKIIHMFHKQETLAGKLGVLKRLIRGLGATKHDLRQGSYANFSCILKQLPKENFDLSTIEDLILKTLNPGSSSKQEIGEAYLGQVLAYSAIVHTNHLDDQPDQLEKIALALMELSTKRSYLCAECFECLCVLISKVPKEFRTDGFIEQLKAINTYTLDKLLYLLYLQNSFPDSPTIKEVFGFDKLLSKSNAPKLAELILKSSISNSKEHKFYESFCTKIARKIRFTTTFWNSVSSLMSEEIKKDHPSMAMIECYLMMCSSLLSQVIKQELDPKYVDILMQDSVVALLLSHGRKYSKSVQSISESVCTLLQKVDDQTRMLFLKKVLLSPNGSLSFDGMSGTRMVTKTMLLLGEDNVIELAGRLREMAETKAVPNQERLIALYLYCGLLSHKSCYEKIEWRLEGLKFLLKSGFFSDTNFNVEFAGLIKNAFYSQISNRFPSLAAYTVVLKELVTFLNKGVTSKSLRGRIDPELADTWKHAMKLIKNIDQHLSDSKNEIIQAIYVLTLYMCLILFKEQEDTKISLQDIGSIFDKITKSSDKPKEGPAWIEVIMDLFLNLLSKPCSSHRHIIGCIFKYLVPHVNDEAFAQLISVLNSSWTHKVFEDGRQADEVSSSGSGEDTDDEDDDDEDKDQEDTEEDTEEDTTTGNALLKENLQNKLRDIIGPKDDDMSDIDVENIDEEEAQRIDAALVEAFKSSAKLPMNIVHSRENHIIQFQIKVLDLLETISKHGMSCSKLLTVIPALLNLYKTAVTKNQNSLKNKLLSTIQKIVSSKAIRGESTEERAEVITLLQHLLTQASFASGANTELRPQLTSFSVYLIKNYASFDGDDTHKNNDIVNVFSEYLDEFFRSSKCHLQLAFFKSLCESVWPGLSKFLKKIAEYSASSNIKLHKRIEALKLLKSYFNNSRYFLNMTPEQESNIKKCGNVILKFDAASSTSVDSKYYTALWNLIMVFLKSKASHCIKWVKWKNLVETTVYPARKPVIKKKEIKRFKKMCSMLEISDDLFTRETTPQPPPMPTRSELKRKKTTGQLPLNNIQNDDEEATENSQPTNQNIPNKRKRVNVNKLKKQSKMLRMESMNVGLEPNVFSNAQLMDTD